MKEIQKKCIFNYCFETRGKVSYKQVADLKCLRGQRGRLSIRFQTTSSLKFFNVLVV